MKHGFLKGHKVAECQNSQTQLMARFLKDGVVDKGRDSENTPTVTPPETDAPPPPVTPAPTPDTPPEAVPDFDGGQVNGSEITDGEAEQHAEENTNEKTKRGKRRD